MAGVFNFLGNSGAFETENLKVRDSIIVEFNPAMVSALSQFLDDFDYNGNDPEIYTFNKALKSQEITLSEVSNRPVFNIIDKKHNEITSEDFAVRNSIIFELNSGMSYLLAMFIRDGEAEDEKEITAFSKALKTTAYKRKQKQLA